MGQTRFSRDVTLAFLVREYRGLLLTVCMRMESIKLLLGCTSEEAKLYQEEARGRLWELKRRVDAARAI